MGQAMDTLKAPEAERQKYLDMIKKVKKEYPVGHTACQMLRMGALRHTEGVQGKLRATMYMMNRYILKESVIKPAIF